MVQVTADILVDKAVFADYVSERRPVRLLRTLTIFVTELDGKVSTLSDARANRDVEALRAVTHSMLGSAVMLGVKRMVDLGAMLEQDCLEAQEIDWALVDELQSIAKETALLFKNMGTMHDIEAYIGATA